MRKVLRDYAKRKKGNLAIIGTIPVPTSKDKSPRLLAGKETFNQAMLNDP